MKLSWITLIGLSALAASAWANAGEVHFRGILDLGSSRLFSVATDGGARTAWVEEGDAFAGYEVAGYDPDESTLLLKKEGEEFWVPLTSGGKVAEESRSSTIDDANKLLQSMKFDEMLARSMEHQREAMADFTRQMMQQMGEEVDEEAIAIQMQVLDIINEEVNWPELQEEVAGLYGETFTSGELRGLIDFYSTPAGEAFANKQPEIERGMMEIMQPRIMRAMPRIQELIQEAAMERAKDPSTDEATDQE